MTVKNAAQTNNASHDQPAALAMAHRVLLSLVGSYAFSFAFTLFGIAGLVALGVDFHEAEITLMLLGFFVFVPLFLWAFVARRLLTVWVVCGGGAALMTAGAWGLQQMILS